jgi:hypothetical protein
MTDFMLNMRQLDLKKVKESEKLPKETRIMAENTMSVSDFILLTTINDGGFSIALINNFDHT